MSVYICKFCGSKTTYMDERCWKCRRIDFKNIDVAETVYKDSFKKLDIDIEGDTKNIIELLAPAIVDNRKIESVDINISEYVKKKYGNGFPCYELLYSLRKIFKIAIKQREYDKKQNEFKSKVALKVYNAQMSEPVKDMGFSIITNDFISAASYVALSTHNVKKQIKKQEANALKTLNDNLKSIITDSSMCDEHVIDALQAIGDMMRMIERFAEIKHFVANHFDLYVNVEKYDSPKEIHGFNLYEAVVRSIAVDSFCGILSHLGNEEVAYSLEAAGYIYIWSDKWYVTTTKFEQEILQEIYYKEHPEEKKKAEELAQKQIIQFYNDAQKQLEMKKYYDAALLFNKAKGYMDAQNQCNLIWQKYILSKTAIKTDISSACACKQDGSVEYANNKGIILDWNNINQVGMCGFGVVGLTNDGEVRCTIDNVHGSEKSILGNGTSWKNIVQITDEEHHLVGLHSNGKVSAVGSNEDGSCNVKDWSGVKKIIADLSVTMGLREDGTVLLAGREELCSQNYQSWHDIQDIAVSYYSALGLKSDGTVEAISTEDYIESVSTWRNVIRIKTVKNGVIGFTTDGNVLYAGREDSAKAYLQSKENVVDVHRDNFDFWIILHSDGTVSSQNAHYDVSDWDNMVFVTGNRDYACGVTRYGEVRFAGKGRYDDNCFEEMLTWKLFDDINTFVGSNPDVIRTNIENKKHLIKNQIAELQKELSELKGLFVGKKKKTLFKKISELEQYLEF